MKAKDLVRQYSLDGPVFENWIKVSNYVYKTGALGGIDIDDSQNIDSIVSDFNRFYRELKERQAAEQADLDAASRAKAQALANMLITSGFNFDGYTITKYSGYISGDDAVQIDRGTVGWFSSATNVGDSLMSSLVHIRRNALAELKEAAYALGCNAVIGVDFDYLTLEPETANSNGGTTYLPYVFGVTANGNAVVIERQNQM